MYVPDPDWIKVIHVAKKDRGLSDQEYRDLLAGCAGVSSAKEIATLLQFEAVMNGFKSLGFVRAKGKLKTLKVTKDDLVNGGLHAKPTSRQLYYAIGLWELASKVKTKQSLNALLKRICKVEHLRFASRGDLSAFIQALRDICRRAGFNPDSRDQK